MKFYLAAILAVGALSFTERTNAQSQTTLGQCSPAINDVKGDVNITCITSERRIRIAKFRETIDDDKGKGFATFISNNLGKIVFVDTYSNMSDGFYDSNGWLSLVDYCPDGSECGEVHIFFNEFDKESTAFVNHGVWAFHGYYLVSGGGFAMGAVEYALKPINEETIVMSPKFDAD